MALINKKELKKLLKNQNMRAGEESIKKLINVCEEQIKLQIQKSVRNAKLSGRKNLKKEDMDARKI